MGWYNRKILSTSRCEWLWSIAQFKWTAPYRFGFLL